MKLGLGPVKEIGDLWFISPSFGSGVLGSWFLFLDSSWRQHFGVQVQWEALGRSRQGWRRPAVLHWVGSARCQPTRTGIKPPPKPAGPGYYILSLNHRWGWRASVNCKWQPHRGAPQVAGWPPATGPATTAVLQQQQGTPSGRPARPAQQGCLAA